MLAQLPGHCMALVGDCRLVLELEHCRTEHYMRAQKGHCRKERCKRAQKERCMRALMERYKKALPEHCKKIQQVGCMRAQEQVRVHCKIEAAHMKMGLVRPELRKKNQSCLK